MSQKTIYLSNLKEVQNDFQNQGKNFDKAIAKSMRVIGMELKKTQKDILRRHVKANPTGKWTGNLSKSIFSRPRKRSVTVGADLSKASYADWVEQGGRGGFMGYWYMKFSININKAFILNRLKKDMGVQSKLKY